jgi:hypothetical protein
MTEEKKKRKPGAGSKPGRKRAQWHFYMDKTAIEQLRLIDRKIIEAHLLKLILSID